MTIPRVGLIGYGAIGTHVHRLLCDTPDEIEVVAIFDQNPDPAKRAQMRDARPTSSFAEFIGSGLDVVVECAGHAAVRNYAVEVLENGCDLVLSSVGVLADQDVEDSLRSASRRTRKRLVIPSGALSGLDGLASARTADIASVVYSAYKKPVSWSGTAAETMIDLNTVTEPTAFFTGNARQAALAFPQNANVVAALALAGCGFEKTQVTLHADPTVNGNKHVVVARGAFGEITSSVIAKTLPENPKTSMLAPHSIRRAVMNLAGSLVI